MAASKQARTYVNTLPQCSPTSVGLAQARPNYSAQSSLSVFGGNFILAKVRFGASSLKSIDGIHTHAFSVVKRRHIILHKEITTHVESKTCNYRQLRYRLL